MAQDHRFGLKPHQIAVFVCFNSLPPGNFFQSFVVCCFFFKINFFEIRSEFRTVLIQIRHGIRSVGTSHILLRSDQVLSRFSTVKHRRRAVFKPMCADGIKRRPTKLLQSFIYVNEEVDHCYARTYI